MRPISTLMPELSLAFDQHRLCKALVYADGTYEMMIAVGDRPWTVRLTEAAGWIRFRCPLVAADGVTLDRLVSLIAINGALGVARVAIDDRFDLTLAAEFPSGWPDVHLLTFARLYSEALALVLHAELPDIPGRGEDGTSTWFPSDRHLLSSAPSTAWRTDVPPVVSAFGRVITIDTTRDPDYVHFLCGGEPIALDQLTIRILLDHEDHTLTKHLMDPGDHPGVVASWPRRLMTNDVFETLVKQVAIRANHLETLLAPARARDSGN